MKEIKLEDDKPTIKRDAKYWFSLIVLVIIVITFIIGQGITSNYSSGAFTFGSYDGVAINYGENSLMDITKDESYYSFFSLYAGMFGPDVTKNFLDSSPYMIWKDAFDRVVFKLALYSALLKEGGYVSDKKVNVELVSHPIFQEDGSFSIKKYKSVATSTVQALQAAYEKNLAREQVMSDFQDFNYFSSDVDFLMEMASEKRSLQFVLFDFKKFPESEALLFAKSNPELFSKITIATITLDDEKSAGEVLKKVQAKEDFSSLAKNYSKDQWADKNGDRGENYFYQLKTTFNQDDLKKIFAIKMGETSQIIKDRDGKKFIIVKVLSEVKPFVESDAKDVVEYITENEKSLVEKFFTKMATDFKSNATPSFSEYATSQNLPVYETNAFPINYGGLNLFDGVSVVENKANIDVRNNEEFFKSVFSLKKGEIGIPVTLEGSIMLFVVKDIVKSENDEALKSTLEDKWRKFVSNQIAQNLKETMIDKKKLKDNFEATYKKYLGPQDSSSSESSQESK